MQQLLLVLVVLLLLLLLLPLLSLKGILIVSVRDAVHVRGAGRGVDRGGGGRMLVVCCVVRGGEVVAGRVVQKSRETLGRRAGRRASSAIIRVCRQLDVLHVLRGG